MLAQQTSRRHALPGRPGASADLEMSTILRETADAPHGRDTADSTMQDQDVEIPKWKSAAILIASFTVIFTCCGFNFAFGVYQAHYEHLAQQSGNPFTGSSPAQIDLIGTLGISFMTLGAPFVVAWAKLFSPRVVSAAGGLLFGLSLVLASFGTQLWHFHLTQGLLLGVGTSLSYMVAVTVAPSWFTARRGLAMGIILSGTGLGGLVFAPILRACFDSIGFRNSLRWTGVLSAVLVTVASMALAWEPATQRIIDTENASRSGRAASMFKVPLLDVRVAKSRKFAAQALGGILQAAAYYTPVFFFASYARTLGYSDAAGANFIAVSNACNFLGKIVIGYAADHVGRLNLLFLTSLVAAVATIGFWLPSTLYTNDGESKNLFIAFTVIYGIFSSAYVSLFPTSLVELFGPQNFASVNGVLYMVRGMATMIGTPVGGALIRHSGAGLGPRTYLGMSTLVGALLLASTVAVFWVRIEAMISPDGMRMWKWKQ